MSISIFSIFAPTQAVNSALRRLNSQHQRRRGAPSAACLLGVTGFTMTGKVISAEADEIRTSVDNSGDPPTLSSQEVPDDTCTT